MLRVNKKILSIISAMVLSSSLILCDINSSTVEVSASTTSLNSYGLTNDTADGTILHAFSWSFNTIKSKMKEIADAGYSSIQVSPIERCYQQSGQHTWEWENTYQPTKYEIGNYVVGSRDEFKSMCDEADKYGIKIIVDIVANHVSPHWEQVDSSLKNGQNFYHNKGGVQSWTNRWNLTQQDLLGLPDLNTANKNLQNMLINFIHDCQNCGADGFRFDTTKHIELPTNIDGSFGSDFWPTITSAIKAKDSNAFIYGEVLQDTGDAYYGYSQYLGLTADSYGASIRNAITSHNIMGIGDYNSSGVSADKLVTYSETHDTYANADGSSAGLNDWQVRKGYEIVAARDKGTPLFLARPKSTGRDGNGKLEGPMGQPGDDWNNSEVKAVNKFHNAMVGKSEYIRKINNNTIAIERGKDGMVVVNLDGGFDGYIDTFMNSGTYKDQVSGRESEVSNGKIHVKVNSGMTAVIYNPEKGSVIVDPIDPSEEKTAYLKLPAGWGEPYAYVYEEGGGSVKQNAAWPGIKMSKVSDGLYSYKVDSSFTNPLVIFNDKNNQYPASGASGLSLSKSMILEGNSWAAYNTSQDPEVTKKIAYIELPLGWNEPYAYVYEEGSGSVKQNAAWPGIKMIKVSDRLYKYEVDSSFTNPLVIFNDGNNQYPASGQKGLSLNGSMIYKNDNWSLYAD